jgi:hypothetical protein
MKSSYAIILVPSVAHATRAESLLKAMGLRCKLIPVPRSVRSDCGVCVRVERKDMALATAALRGGAVTVLGVLEI